MRAATCALLLVAAGCGRGFSFEFKAGTVPDAPASFRGLAAGVEDAARLYPKPGERPAPARLVADDGTALRLERLEARAVVLGPLAVTELHYRFANPDARVREGRFSVELPRGAAVTRLAMLVGGAWREAEIAPLAKARAGYEAVVEARRDPALGELAPGGRFHARVFPIAANGQVELVVAYVEPRADGRAPYRLPLVGLPAVPELVTSVRVGDQVHEWKGDGVAPERDLEVAAEGLPAALASGGLAVARVTPELPAAPDAPAALTVLFDTSASRVWRFRTDVARLDALLQVVGAAQPELALRVVAFDQSAEVVFDGRAGAWGDAAVARLLLRRPLGASNLAGALAWTAARARPGRLVVWSDFAPTAGETAAAAVAAAVDGAGARWERVDAVLADGGGDEALARRLVRARGGRRAGVLVRGETAPEALRARLWQRVFDGVEVRVPGARWYAPARVDGLVPGDAVVVAVERDEAAGGTAAAPAALTVELAGAVEATVEVQAAPGARLLLDQAVAAARIADLEASGAGRAEIAAVSREHHVLSRVTAVVLLETEADYRRFGIDPAAPAELMIVGKQGLRVVPRRIAPAAVSKRPVRAVEGGQGEVHGVVIDARTGEPVVGATVVAKAAGGGDVAQISDEQGRFVLGGVAVGAGEVVVTVYYGEAVVRQRVAVPVGGVGEVELRVDTASVGGETITISEKRPGIAIDQQYTKNVPVGGRTYEGVMGASAGAQGDGMGTSFSGGTDAENVYVIEGINTGGGGAVGAPPLAPAAPGGGAGGGGSARGGGEGLADLVVAHVAVPDDVVALRALGAALAGAGRPALAARVYGSLLDLYPGRADIQRLAGQWLESLGGPGDELALDAYARALADRPDQPGGYRFVAYALGRRGRWREAVDVLARALARRESAAIPGFRDVVRQELGVFGAGWVAAEPGKREAIRARLAGLGATIEDRPSLRLVLTWESTQSDVDLHVFDGGGNEASAAAPTLPDYGGMLVADVSAGWGPEVFVIDSPDAFPYRVEAHVQERGPAGPVLGRLQLVRHDGRGRVTLDERPFALRADEPIADLGTVSTTSHSSPKTQ